MTKAPDPISFPLTKQQRTLMPRQPIPLLAWTDPYLTDDDLDDEGDDLDEDDEDDDLWDSPDEDDEDDDDFDATEHKRIVGDEDAEDEEFDYDGPLDAMNDR